MLWLHVQIPIQDVNVDHAQLVMLAMESTVKNSPCATQIMEVALPWRHAQKVVVRSLVNVVQDTLVMALVRMDASKLI